MKRVAIYDYARSGISEGHLLSAGVEHDKLIELDEAALKELVLKLFVSGLNVMLRHSDGKNGFDIVLCVDTGAFTQR